MNTPDPRRSPLQADIIDALGAGPATTSELAAKVGTTYRSAAHALDALTDTGHVLRSGWRMVHGHGHYLFRRSPEVRA